MENTNLQTTELIKCEVDRLSRKYEKDFLDCEDIVKITGLEKDNVRSLLRSQSFQTTKVGRRQVVSIINFVTWMIFNNKEK